MSVGKMTEAWMIDLKPADKLVLMALADISDDSGFCWPSMAHLAGKCSMTERGVRGIVRRLEDAGLLSCEQSAGRQSNRYTVLPNPEQASALEPENTSSNPEPRSRNELPGLASTRNDTTLNPERHDTQPGTAVPPNHQEPPRTTKSKDDLSEIINLLKPIIGEQLTRDFIDHRKRLKKPLSLKAASYALGQLLQLKKQGYDPKACMEEAIGSGWLVAKVQYFQGKPKPIQKPQSFLDKYLEEERRRDDRRPH